MPGVHAVAGPEGDDAVEEQFLKGAAEFGGVHGSNDE